MTDCSFCRFACFGSSSMVLCDSFLQIPSWFKVHPSCSTYLFSSPSSSSFNYLEARGITSGSWFSLSTVLSATSVHAVLQSLQIPHPVPAQKRHWAAFCQHLLLTAIYFVPCVSVPSLSLLQPGPSWFYLALCSCSLHCPPVHLSPD